MCVEVLEMLTFFGISRAILLSHILLDGKVAVEDAIHLLSDGAVQVHRQGEFPTQLIL